MPMTWKFTEYGSDAVHKAIDFLQSFEKYGDAWEAVQSLLKSQELEDLAMQEALYALSDNDQLCQNYPIEDEWVPRGQDQYSHHIALSHDGPKTLLDYSVGYYRMQSKDMVFVGNIYTDAYEMEISFEELVLRAFNQDAGLADQFREILENMAEIKLPEDSSIKAICNTGPISVYWYWTQASVYAYISWKREEDFTDEDIKAQLWELLEQANQNTDYNFSEENRENLERWTDHVWEVTE